MCGSRWCNPFHSWQLCTLSGRTFPRFTPTFDIMASQTASLLNCRNDAPPPTVRGVGLRPPPPPPALPMEATFAGPIQLSDDDPQPVGNGQVDTVSSAVAAVSEPVQPSAINTTAKTKRPSGKGRLSKGKRVRVAIGDVALSCEDTAITNRLQV
jgi:hypothetical protein